MIDIFIAIFLGIIFGTVSGIIPGIHVNTVGIIVFSVSDKIIKYTNSLCLSSFFVSISICHAMIEFIPSLLFGIPTEDTITSIQPGHRLLFESKGLKTIRLVSIGGYLSIIFLIISIPLLFVILPIIYELLNNYIGYLLIVVIILMIYFTNNNNINRLYSSLIFICSGILGICVLNSNLGSNLSLLVLLSGLFSSSTLLYSINQNSTIPKQNNDKIININKNFIKSITAGSLSGCILGLLPGLGPAQGTIIAQTLTFNKNIKAEDYILTNSGVNISDTLFSIISIYLINNPRSAISVYISHLINNITIKHVLFFIGVSLISVSIACLLSIKIGDYIIERINNFNYHNLNMLIVFLISSFILLYTILTHGCLWFVVLCYITSISLGLLPNLLDISKSNLMGLLIIPSILTYTSFI